MLVQLLQLTFITCHVTEACFPFRILPKPEQQCDTTNCGKNERNVTTTVTSHIYDCPKKIDSATKVSGKLYIFSNDKVWVFKDQKEAVFPKGPPYVNVSVSTKYHTYLIKDRTIFAYDTKKHTFRPRKGWPKMLQHRVLFFPQAAFPIKNGSAILVSGDVFATYDLEHNEVSLIYDLETYYPNLPKNFRSGIPFPAGQFETYHVLDEQKMYQYNMTIKQITFAQPIKTYLSC